MCVYTCQNATLLEMIHVTAQFYFYIAGVVSKFKCNSIILRLEKSKYPVWHTVVACAD